MKLLQKQLTEIEKYLPKIEQRNDRISKATIGWHLDHSLRVINSIVLALEQSDTAHFKKKHSPVKSFVLITGYIPRGKGRVPKKVASEETVLLEGLKRRIGYAYENMEKIQNLNSGAHFSHPVFGSLNRNQAVRFIRIHTNHHLKIIRDILKPY